MIRMSLASKLSDAVVHVLNDATKSYSVTGNYYTVTAARIEVLREALKAYLELPKPEPKKKLSIATKVTSCGGWLNTINGVLTLSWVPEESDTHAQLDGRDLQNMMVAAIKALYVMPTPDDQLIAVVPSASSVEEASQGDGHQKRYAPDPSDNQCDCSLCVERGESVSRGPIVSPPVPDELEAQTMWCQFGKRHLESDGCDCYM